MTIQLPSNRLGIKQIQLAKRNIPLEQIIAVGAQNPLATGIEELGGVIGKTLQNRSELRRQGEQLAKLEALSGQAPGSYSGLNPDTATALTTNLIKKSQENFNPRQVKAILSGDAREISSSFPNGVPKEALTAALSKERSGNLQSERDRAQADRIDKNILQYSEALEKNPVVKGMRTQEVSLGQMDNLINLAANGNTVASSAMGTKMARAMGEVGVLTESDIKRYVQSGQLARGAGDKLSLMAQGRPTETTMEEISQIASVLKDSYATKVQPVYDTYVNRLSRNLDITPEDAAFRLDVPYSGSKQTKLKTIEPKKPQVITPKKIGRFIVEEAK